MSIQLYKQTGYAIANQPMTTDLRSPKQNTNKSPLVVVVLLPVHRFLALPQCLRKAARQASVRRTVGRATATAPRRVLRVHAHSAVPRRGRRWRRHLAACHVGSFRGWCRRGGLCFGGSGGRGAVRRGGRPRGRRGRWWRRRFLFFQIRLGSPALNGCCRVHAQPPAWFD